MYTSLYSSECFMILINSYTKNEYLLLLCCVLCPSPLNKWWPSVDRSMDRSSGRKSARRILDILVSYPIRPAAFWALLLCISYYYEVLLFTTAVIECCLREAGVPVFYTSTSRATPENKWNHYRVQARDISSTHAPSRIDTRFVCCLHTENLRWNNNSTTCCLWARSTSMYHVTLHVPGISQWWCYQQTYSACCWSCCHDGLRRARTFWPPVRGIFRNPYIRTSEE